MSQNINNYRDNYISPKDTPEYDNSVDFQRDYDSVMQQLRNLNNADSNSSLDEMLIWMKGLPYDKIMKYLLDPKHGMRDKYPEFLNLFNAYYQKRYPKSMVSRVPNETTKKEVQKVKTEVEATRSLFDSQRDYALSTLSKNNKKVEHLQKALNVVLPKDVTYGTIGPITLKALVEYQKLHQKELNISDKELWFFWPKTYALLFPSVQASAPTPIITPTVITEQTPEVVKNSSSSARSASASSVASSSPSLDIRPVWALGSNSFPLSFQGHSTSLRSSSSSLSSVRSAVWSSSSNSSQEIRLNEDHMNDQKYVNELIKKSNGASLTEDSSNAASLTEDSSKFKTNNSFVFIKDGLRIGGNANDRYIWDEPKDGKRTIYLLDQNNWYKAKAIVDKDGKVETNTGINPKLITYQVSLKSKN